MKKTFLLLVVIGLMATKLNAQNSISAREFDTYHEHADFYLSNLIKSDTNLFKSGILYDRVFQMADLNAFNSPTNNSSSYSHFMRAWDELHLANTKQNSFLPPEIARQIAFSMEMKDTVAIGIINLDYTTIDTLALDSLTLAAGTGSLSLDNNGLLVRTVGQNPYVDKHRLMISPLSKKTVVGNKVTLSLSPMMILNASKSIDKLTVSYGTKSVILLNNSALENETATFNFTSSGTKTIKFIVNFSDGSTMSTYGKIDTYLPSAAELLSLNQVQTINATDAFVGYDEPNDCYGNCYGNGEYQIFLADNNTELTQPIIIVDGFDPNDTRGITIENEEDAGSILELMKYMEPGASFPTNIKTKLNEEGYDVIVLNFTSQYLFTHFYKVKTYFFYDKIIDLYTQLGLVSMFGGYNKFFYAINIFRDGGADYLERNANVLKELIRQTNQTLIANQSVKELVLIGPSMGGLICRIALTEMEQNNEDHNTRIYLSFDSPHKGANIAIGVQKLFQYKDNKEGLYNMNTVAAKQMLINHYSEHDNWESPQQHPFRLNYFAPLLDNLGFPVQTDRNIAWINGAINGNPIGEAGGNIIDIDKDIIAWVLILPIPYHVWLKIRRDDSGVNSKVFSVKEVNSSSVSKYAFSHAFEGSLDASPGGAFEIARLIQEGWNQAIADAISDDWYVWGVANSTTGEYDTNPDENFCFIPTKSALAYTGPNDLWVEDISCTDLVCMGWTPFDNYYAPEDNQFHVSVTHEGVQWVLKELELDGTPEYMYNEGCSDIETEIIGNSVVCYKEIETYTLNNDCGVDYWETSIAFSIISSDSYSITIKKTDHSSVDRWIKAVLWTGEEVVKNIVSKPSVSWSLNYFNYDMNMYQLKLDPLNSDWDEQNITDIVWTQTGGNGILSVTHGGFGAEVIHQGSFILFGNVSVTNKCGTTVKSFVATNTDISIDPNGGYTPPSLYILDGYEVNSYIVIDSEQIGDSQISDSELFDLFGNQVEEFVFTGDEVIIDDATGLPQLRVLKVYMNDKEQERLIIVQ